MGDAVNRWEYRPCTVNLGIKTKKGVFHCWTLDGGGIVEDETGQCGEYGAGQIMFDDPMMV